MDKCKGKVGRQWTNLIGIMFLRLLWRYLCLFFLVHLVLLSVLFLFVIIVNKKRHSGSAVHDLGGRLFRLDSVAMH